MYMETRDWPLGMLGLELDELLLLQAKKINTAATPASVPTTRLGDVSHLVTVFMLCSFIGRGTPSFDF